MPHELESIVSLQRCHDGGPVDGPVDCGEPSRHELDGQNVGHGASWSRAQHLCRGMRMLQDASCAQLSNTSFLQEVIQTTGVTYDPRKRDVCHTALEPRTNRLDPGRRRLLLLTPSGLALDSCTATRRST